jgi:hypothetical protein
MVQNENGIDERKYALKCLGQGNSGFQHHKLAPPCMSAFTTP